jgi:hypothetical protein
MSRFLELASATEEKAAKFQTMAPQPFLEGLRRKGAKGIYALFEAGDQAEHAVYVGRTRNLAGRFRAHITANHNSASFALKRTRVRHNLPTTYTALGSRAAIVSESGTRATFLEEIQNIRKMTFRFMEEADPVSQYLLELAVTINYDLPLDGFDSH